MRMIFMGTPDFAVTCLDAVLAAGHEVAAVITQPDRPKGRGKKLAFPPMKERALALGLTVHQPERVKDEAFVELLRQYQPEVIVVVAYGRILPQAVLELPPYGCLNVHGSLLPKYRGAAPIQWAVLHGDDEAGVTIQQMDVGMDTGAMLMKGTVPILSEDTTGTMFEKLAVLGGELLVQTLTLLPTNCLQAEKQDETQVTYAPMLTKEDEIIDWHRSAEDLWHQVRGLSPTPGAYTFYQGERLKIWQVMPLDEDVLDVEPGTVIEVDSQHILVQTGQGCLAIFEVQPAGKKTMPVSAFQNGWDLAAGAKLGNYDE